MNILLETTSCEGWTESGTDRSVYFCIDDFLNTTIQMNNSCSLVSLLLLFSLISFKFLFKELISAKQLQQCSIFKHSSIYWLTLDCRNCLSLAILDFSHKKQTWICQVLNL